MATRESFTFFLSFRECAEGLEGLARLEFLEAIMDFAFTGKEPEFQDRVSRALFAGIRPNLLKGWQGYNNGLKGGAPVGTSNAQNNPKTTQKQPKNNPKTTHARVNNYKNKYKNKYSYKSKYKTQETMERVRAFRAPAPPKKILLLFLQLLMK